ncbi:unnamed protein product [Ranitomeya imitator]|uniref:GPI ethanolamine phosphate transferase 2 C-terminal domain-containing protein n=1 Tax=Ranitomeya imitator TaxID=111125 RepID=A0ABN9KTI8_9NEOB|nr:unnamed protein product [Ranitomeya imitator]
MDYAVPRYELPSRHFFSRKAIPALHQHVKERIVHALRQSVSTKVHLTTDAWTSRHGQGRYVSITAHWVNVVDAGSTGDSKFGTVLPSPRSRKQLAVAVRTPSSSSSSSCRSESSSTDRSRTTTPSPAATVAHQVSHYGAATGKRQQAVLAMKCLGDNRHTAEVLSEFLQKETQSWLGTVDLEAGKNEGLQGNSNTISTVDVSAGFVGLENYVEMPAIFLTAFVTYTGPLLWSMHLLCYLSGETNKTSPAVAHGCYCYAIIRSLPVTAYILLVTGLRYHLFIWSVFSPKLLYEVIHLVISAGICVTFTVVDKNQVAKSEV